MSDATTNTTVGPTSGMSIGTKVILILAVLTLAEYVVAVGKPAGQIPIIFAIAIVKAVLIVVYFMHVKQIWRGESE